MKNISIKVLGLVFSSALFAAPTSFSTFDANSDGVVTQDEFYATQARNMEQRASENRMMKNAQNAPSFEDIDTNKDGKITQEEHQEFQYKRMNENRNKSQYQYNNGFGNGSGGFGSGGNGNGGSGKGR